MEAERNVKKRLTTPLPGIQKDKLKSDFLLTKENQIPLNAAHFQTVGIGQLYIQKECDLIEEEQPFRELNFLSRFGLKEQDLSCLSPCRAIRALLVCKRESNSQGILKGLFPVKYDSLQKPFLLPFTLSMRKLIFLTKIALRSSCNHFPLGSILGHYLREELEDKWVAQQPQAGGIKVILSVLDFGLLAQVKSQQNFLIRKSC